MDFNELVSEQLKQINQKLDAISERISLLERESDRNKALYDKFNSQLEEAFKYVKEQHVRIKAVEESPAIKFNSIYKQIIDKVVLLITGGIAVWLVSWLFPHLSWK